MKLRFTVRALNDLTQTADYFESRNPVAGQRVLRAIYEGLRNIASFPQSGRRQSVEGVRKFVTRRHRYFIYYPVDIAADELRIITVAHPVQQRDFEDA
jgi:toxin ParE1/3/4